MKLFNKEYIFAIVFLTALTSANHTFETCFVFKKQEKIAQM